MLSLKIILKPTKKESYICKPGNFFLKNTFSTKILDTVCIANISVMFLFPKYPLLKFLSHENTFLMSTTEVN